MTLITSFPNLGVSGDDRGRWHLTYDAHHGHHPGDIAFGTSLTGIVLVNPPDISYPDAAVDDAPLPVEDGIRFGKDFTAGMTLTFTANVLSGHPGHDNYAANRADLTHFKRMWDADGLRASNAAVATLTAHFANNNPRHVIGRPRRWAPGTLATARQGVTPVVFDFQCIDKSFYAEQRQVAAHAKGKHGWDFGITVDGTTSTQPVIVIDGPIVNPRVQVGDAFVASLGMTVAAGAQVTIDPRKWARTVLRHDGASVANHLHRSSASLRDMIVTPGHYRVKVSGDKIRPGRTKVTVKWADAYSFL